VGLHCLPNHLWTQRLTKTTQEQRAPRRRSRADRPSQPVGRVSLLRAAASPKTFAKIRGAGGLGGSEGTGHFQRTDSHQESQKQFGVTHPTINGQCLSGPPVSIRANSMTWRGMKKIIRQINPSMKDTRCAGGACNVLPNSASHISQNFAKYSGGGGG